MRVKIWTADGPHRLLRRAAADRRASTRSAPTSARRSATGRGARRAQRPDEPENRFERGQGRPATRSTRASARPTGRRCCSRPTSVRAPSSRAAGDIWLPFACPLLVGAAPALARPGAARVAARSALRRSQREREALLVHGGRGLDRRAPPDRRRPARRRRAGPRRPLVLAQRRPRSGAAARSDAGADAASAGGARRVTRASAIRQLRTLLVEIHPPNLRAAGLDAALADLLAPLRHAGIDDRARRSPTARLEPPRRSRSFSARRGEAIRNVAAARAARARSRRASRAPTAGCASRSRTTASGSSPSERERRRSEGHVGLSLLEELARRGAASLEVRSPPGAGTSFSLEVPRRDPLSDRRRPRSRARRPRAARSATFEDVELVGAAANGEEAVALCAERRAGRRR